MGGASQSREELDIDDIMRQFEKMQLADPETAEIIAADIGYVGSDGSTSIGSDSLLKCPDYLLAHDIDEGDAEMKDLSEPTIDITISMQRWMMQYYLRSLLEKSD